MELTWEEQLERDRQHLADPQVGDYWHEMLTPICVVVGRKPDAVVICENIRETDYENWTWDIEEVGTVRLAAFRRWLSHKAPALQDRTWCHVEPRAHP